MRSKAIPYVVLLGFLWGSTLVVSRFSVGQYDPRTYISLRLLIAASAHLFVYAISGWIIAERPWPRDRRLWKRASIFGIFGTAVSMTCIVSSLQYQSSGVTALLLTLGPVVTVILAQFFLPDEQLTWQIALGVVVAVAGASLLLLQGENGLAEFTDADWRGYAWALVGITSSAAASVYARRYLRTANSWDVASIRMFAAALILFVVTFFTVGYDLSQVTAAGYVGLVYAALVGSFAGMWLSFYIIKRFGATSASQTSYVLPVVTVILGSLVLDEQITSTMIIGMLIIFIGLALLNWQRDASPTRRRRKWLGIASGE